MSQYAGPETIPLSYLNAIEYCPRRFYYEFVEGDMLENEFVLSGSLLHERTDQPGQHAVEGEQVVTHLYLYSASLRLSGFADVVEEEHGLFVPVEYKHGKEGKWLNDHIQLCAQASCLEERLPERAPTYPLWLHFLLWFAQARPGVLYAYPAGKNASNDRFRLSGRAA